MAGLTCTFSILPTLEPILGLAVAFGVGYLGLPRFRYRDEIRRHTRKEIDRFQTAGGPLSQVKENGLYRQLTQFAELPQNDDTKAEPFDKAELPNGWWSKTYSRVFESHRDIKIVIGTTVFSGFLLALSVAQQLSMVDWTICLFGIEASWLWYTLTILCCLIPPALVVQGDKVVKWALDHVTRRAADIEGLIDGRGASNARLKKELPESKNGPR